MPNDRSDAALQERLELAKKATHGPWALWEWDNGVKEIRSNADPDEDHVCRVWHKEDGDFLAKNSPIEVRADIEEILQLRKERDWLLREIVNTSDKQFCPMPDRYECLYHAGHECKSREVEMRVGCWRTAVECAVKYEEGKNNVE